MNNKRAANFNKILKTFPPDVKDQFAKAKPHLEEHLTQEQLYEWVDSGIKIASQSNNSWDITVNLFRVSPIIIGSLKSDEFIPNLEKLAREDLNMKVRDSAIKTLKKVYNKDVG